MDENRLNNLKPERKDGEEKALPETPKKCGTGPERRAVRQWPDAERI
jgi:hypothetical protein